MSPMEHTLEGSEKMSVHDTSVYRDMWSSWCTVPWYCMGLEGDPELFEESHDSMLCVTCPNGRPFGPTSVRYWKVVNTQRTSLSPRLMSTWERTDRTCFNIDASNGPHLEGTCRDWWPPPLVLFPAPEPHNHYYNVLKLFCSPDTVELLLEAWICHVLCFIFDARDYID